MPRLAVPFAALAFCAARCLLGVIHGDGGDGMAPYWPALGAWTALGAGFGAAEARLAPRPRGTATLFVGTLAGCIFTGGLTAIAAVPDLAPSSWSVSDGRFMGALATGTGRGVAATFLFLLLYWWVVPIALRAEDAPDGARARLATAVAFASALSAFQVSPPQGAELLRALSVGVSVAALATLVQIALRDRARAAWLHALFVRKHPEYELVPLGGHDLSMLRPLVGNVFGALLVVHTPHEAAYREGARIPLGLVGSTFTQATAPLQSRRIKLVAVQVTTGLLLALALWVSHTSTPSYEGPAPRLDRAL